MNSPVFLLVFTLLPLSVSSGSYFLRTVCTASSGLELPEFIAVAQVNEVEVAQFDSSTGTVVPSHPWVQQVAEQKDILWYWQRHMLLTSQYLLKNTIQDRKENHTADVQVLQELVGCEWDSDTGQTLGFLQFRLNAKEFLIFKPDSKTWVTPEVFKSKGKFENMTEYWDNYLSTVCPELLRTLVQHENSTLIRTKLPLVYILEKSSSSSVTCLATGFYPERAVIFWTKDGEWLFEGVEPGDILPNGDGTFQTSVSLDLSQVKPEDWGRYYCVFKLSGIEEDIITCLDNSVIRTNSKTGMSNIISVIKAAAVALVIIIAAFIFYKRSAEIRRRSLSGAKSRDILGDF